MRRIGRTAQRTRDEKAPRHAFKIYLRKHNSRLCGRFASWRRRAGSPGEPPRLRRPYQRIFNKSVLAVLCPKMRRFKKHGHRTQHNLFEIVLTMPWPARKSPRIATRGTFSAAC